MTRSTKSDQPIRGVKGFNQDWTCRKFQYEIGQSYKHTGRVEYCESGFHAIAGNPLEVWSYYSPATSKFAVVTQLGPFSTIDGASKVASAEIQIERELGLKDLVREGVNWAKKQPKSMWKESTTNYTNVAVESSEQWAIAQGGKSVAITSALQAVAVTFGLYSHATTFEENSPAITHEAQAHSTTHEVGSYAITFGNKAHATAYDSYGCAITCGASANAVTHGTSTIAITHSRNTYAVTLGYNGKAEVTGGNSIAAALGTKSIARAAEGCGLVLVCYNEFGNKITHIWAGIAGQNGIKPGVWYKLDTHGDPVETTP